MTDTLMAHEETAPKKRKKTSLSSIEFFEKSQALKESGNLDEAIIAAFRSLDAPTNRRKHYEHLGRLLNDAEMPRGAEIVLRHALELGMTKPAIYGLLGRSLFKQKRYDDALGALDQAIAIDPTGAGYTKFREMVNTKCGEVKKS